MQARHRQRLRLLQLRNFAQKEPNLITGISSWSDDGTQTTLITPTVTYVIINNNGTYLRNYNGQLWTFTPVKAALRQGAPASAGINFKVEENPTKTGQASWVLPIIAAICGLIVFILISVVVVLVLLRRNAGPPPERF